MLWLYIFLEKINYITSILDNRWLTCQKVFARISLAWERRCHGNHYWNKIIIYIFWILFYYSYWYEKYLQFEFSLYDEIFTDSNWFYNSTFRIERYDMASFNDFPAPIPPDNYLSKANFFTYWLAKYEKLVIYLEKRAFECIVDFLIYCKFTIYRNPLPKTPEVRYRVTRYLTPPPWCIINETHVRTITGNIYLNIYSHFSK